MEQLKININGINYESQPEQRLCKGCAFHDLDQNTIDQSLCNKAFEHIDCVSHRIIWKPVETQQDETVKGKQVGGTHYQKQIQPWDIIHEWKLDYWRGNVVKYVLRCKEKNGIEDLKKAIHYLEYAIENYEEDIK